MDTNRFGRFDVLVVEPDASATASARAALEKVGARCFVVADLDDAKRCLAQHRIGGMILGPSLSTRGARELLDGLAFSPQQRPRLLRMSPRDPSAGRLGDHVADVLTYVPVLDTAVVSAIGMKSSAETLSGPTHVAALVRASSLSGGIGESMREVASTLRMAFSTDACVIVGSSFGDAWIVGTGASLSQTELVEVRERVLGAARGRTVVVSGEMVTRGAQGACGFESYLGARIIGPDNVRIGLIALVQRGFRPFTSEERDLLEAFGRRLAIELSHRGVKDHLVAELDATREAGGLDPMLGVWSESTLLRLLEMLTASAQRNQSPLTVAVVDVRELGRINELYGHEAGDAVLKHVAELVVYIVRQSDVVARFRGGIAVVFNDTSPGDAATVIKRVQRVFASEDFVVDSGVAIHVETRSGIAALEREGDNAESLLQRAVDAARAAADTKEGLWTSTQPAGMEDAMPVGPGDEGLRGLTLGGMYRLLHEIGSGGGGGVYRGEDLGLNRPVAIKVLNPEQAHSEEANERFRAEAAILAALRHPNLVQ
ncbi:MAG TPA: diguanylate cyclase, partial [Polyangiaceae bacterium]|nr:diguanylate cyclase [Polyangiaceae bacterium]